MSKVSDLLKSAFGMMSGESRNQEKAITIKKPATQMMYKDKFVKDGIEYSVNGVEYREKVLIFGEPNINNPSAWFEDNEYDVVVKKNMVFGVYTTSKRASAMSIGESFIHDCGAIYTITKIRNNDGDLYIYATTESHFADGWFDWEWFNAVVPVEQLNGIKMFEKPAKWMVQKDCFVSREGAFFTVEEVRVENSNISLFAKRNPKDSGEWFHYDTYTVVLKENAISETYTTQKHARHMAMGESFIDVNDALYSVESIRQDTDGHVYLYGVTETNNPNGWFDRDIFEAVVNME